MINIFNINHGEPIIDIKYINHTEEIRIGQKASITLSLDVKDKYNNSVPKEEIINDLNISLYRDINYTLFSLEIEENKNGLLKYSTKNEIQIADSYTWRIFYNGKNISNDYITTVIALSDFSYFEIKLEGNTIKNGSTIECRENEVMYISIYPKDQNGKTLETSEFIEAYFINNQKNGKLKFIKDGYNYEFPVECNFMEKDSNIYLIYKINDTTGTFVFEVKYN